jgi:hypothetical protein
MVDVARGVEPIELLRLDDAISAGHNDLVELG